jgi:hypothetical protein
MTPPTSASASAQPGAARTVFGQVRRPLAGIRASDHDRDRGGRVAHHGRDIGIPERAGKSPPPRPRSLRSNSPLPRHRAFG